MLLSATVERFSVTCKQDFVKQTPLLQVNVSRCGADLALNPTKCDLTAEINKVGGESGGG